MGGQLPFKCRFMCGRIFGLIPRSPRRLPWQQPLKTMTQSTDGPGYRTDYSQDLPPISPTHTHTHRKLITQAQRCICTTPHKFWVCNMYLFLFCDSYMTEQLHLLDTVTQRTVKSLKSFIHSLYRSALVRTVGVTSQNGNLKIEMRVWGKQTRPYGERTLPLCLCVFWLSECQSMWINFVPSHSNMFGFRGVLWKCSASPA